MERIKGSYFPGENYDFENAEDKLVMFVEMLKNRGCYISEDGHIRSKKGGLMSKLTRNGYWLTMASFNRKPYYFCEHRVVWVWHNGAIPGGMEINHIDYNRGNNHIENLEVVTHSENMQHSKINFNPCKGELSPRSEFTNRQAAAIKYLCLNAGWPATKVADFVGTNRNNVYRIKNGTRYAEVPTPQTILEIYPTLVNYTRNTKIGKEEEVKNYLLGLNGEVGELTDIFKKYLYHGKELDPTEVMLELGDILYYIVALCNVLEIDITEILVNNNVKLLSRYKDGFSEEQSNNRIEDNR